MQHYPQFQFMISDPGGCFVSDELREWAGIRGIGLLTVPGEFHGLTAELENLIRVIKRLARKLADDHPDLTLASCVSLACFSHNNGFKTGGYSRVQLAFGAHNEEHGFTTTMPSEIETFRMSARNRYLQEQAKDAISPAQHTTRKENVDLEPGTWVMYFRRGKVTRGAIGAPSKSGLWLGPARVIMTEAVQQWSESVQSTTGQIGVVWVSHGNKLIRCHLTQLRRCSEREVSIASLKGLVQVSMPTSVTELTNALSPGQYEDLSTSLPTREDLRFGEVDPEAPLVDQETMAPSFVPLFPSGTIVAPSQNTSARLSSIPNPVSASSGRESDVQVDESSLTPGSIQIAPRELTRSQGELARSSLENADPATERRRIVGKRTIISPAHLALPDNVDSESVPESLNEAGLREVLEPSEGDTKKRRVESFDESVDWFQRERSSIAWMTNVSDEREIFEIDVGDPLEYEMSFCRDSSVWLSKRLSDGKYRRLLPGQQLQFDEAMTKELSQVLAADAVRRLSQEEELNLKPERLLRMRWVLTWKYTEGGDRKAKARLLQACALHKLRVHFAAFLQTSASEEHQELTIKAPPEVGYLFSESEGKPARYVRLMKPFYGLT